jgi:hypothetical protein
MSFNRRTWREMGSHDETLIYIVLTDDRCSVLVLTGVFKFLLQFLYTIYAMKLAVLLPVRGGYPNL